MALDRSQRNNLARTLILDARKGNRDSLGKLIDLFYSDLLLFMRYRGVIESKCDDFVQETFIRVLRNLDRFDIDRPFLPWLFSIAKFLSVDDFRRQNVRVREETLSGSPASINVEAVVLSRQMAQDLLSRLSNEERFLVRMRIFYGFPFSEIAQMTGDSENALRLRLSRTLHRLRGEVLKDEKNEFQSRL